jgi:hypothetical protein
MRVSEQPVTSHDGQTIERKPHGFTHTDQSIDGTDLGQDVGGVGALLLSLLEPTAFLSYTVRAAFSSISHLQAKIYCLYE